MKHSALRLSLLVGGTWHAMFTGASPDTLARRTLESNELVINKTSEAQWAIDLKAIVNESCIYRSALANRSDDFFRRNRADFLFQGRGRRGIVNILFFSSDPESYFWVMFCPNYVNGQTRCPVNRVTVTLYTRNNPPDSINLEMIGRDLRVRTCLTMEEIPGQFEFDFNQGENTCPAEEPEK